MSSFSRHQNIHAFQLEQKAFTSFGEMAELVATIVYTCQPGVDRWSVCSINKDTLLGQILPIKDFWHNVKQMANTCLLNNNQWTFLLGKGELPLNANQQKKDTEKEEEKEIQHHMLVVLENISQYIDCDRSEIKVRQSSSSTNRFETKTPILLQNVFTREECQVSYAFVRLSQFTKNNNNLYSGYFVLFPKEDK